MLRLHETHRLKLVPLAGAVLAATYFFALRPLKERSQELDQPLADAWRQLAAALGQPATSNNVDFQAIEQRLRLTRQSCTVLNGIEQDAAARAALEETVAARVWAPFQLVDYQNELQKVIEELTQLSQQHKVVLEPPVLGGFPDYATDLKQPSLLWGELAFAKYLLATAIQCGAGTVHRLRVPSPPADPLDGDPWPGPREIPLELELTGTATNLAAMLQCLPLRASEIRAAGLPDAYPDKSALFIDRLILRRQSPNRPEEVRLTLLVSGFVFPE